MNKSCPSQSSAPMLSVFDSHCHIDDKSYDSDRAQVLERAARAGVTAVMLAGITVKTCRKAVALAEKYPGVYAAVGIHPHDAKSANEKVLSELKELAKNPKVRAWGEIGLDFNRMFSPRASQEKWFTRQLAAARELDLPVILHERDTKGRMLEMLRAEEIPRAGGVVHCFSGTKQELEQYLKMGFYIGITGILTQKERGAALRSLVEIIPADRLLVETDAPYLTPAPHKNKVRRNEPAFVATVLEKLCQVRKDSHEELGRTVWENTCRLYNIPGGNGQ